jgi:hypothetical protein
VHLQLAEEFLPTVDPERGVPLPRPRPDEEALAIDAQHQIDLTPVLHDELVSASRCIRSAGPIARACAQAAAAAWTLAAATAPPMSRIHASRPWRGCSREAATDDRGRLAARRIDRYTATSPQ